jgi:hypothetical protein
MPIRPYLQGHGFDDETIPVMGIAFEMARVALRLHDRPDLTNGHVPSRIINYTDAGAGDPERLCELVLHDLRQPPPQV